MKSYKKDNTLLLTGMSLSLYTPKGKAGANSLTNRHLSVLPGEDRATLESDLSASGSPSRGTYYNSTGKGDCRLFEECEAPLCPLQPDRGIWYADEDICRAKRFQSLPWIKKQKKIVKLGLTADVGYFDIEMLDAIRAITKTLQGADPDIPDGKAKWLNQRLEKRFVAAEKRRNNKAMNEKNTPVLRVQNDTKRKGTYPRSKTKKIKR